MSASPDNMPRLSKPSIRGFSHINRYWDKTRNKPAAKILPGEYYVTTEDELILTVLGSCISACIRDPIFQIGGMNHFMLPAGNKHSSMWNDTAASESTRYGNVAMEHLITTIQKNGGRRDNLEVKIAGGGRILASMTDVGRRNIEFVVNYIHTEGLKLAKQDVGDIYPRKVIYNPMDGKLLVKKLRALHNNTIVEREETYMHEIDHTPVEGEIDLF